MYVNLVQIAALLTIPACAGGPDAVIYKSLFANEEFQKVNLPQPATKEMFLNVYDIENLSSFNDITEIFHTDLKHLKFESQEQILKFIDCHRKYLLGYHWGTIFYFEEMIKDRAEGFVAFFNYSDGHSTQFGYKKSLELCSVNESFNFHTNFTRRIVVPANFLHNPRK